MGRTHPHREGEGGALGDDSCGVLRNLSSMRIDMRELGVREIESVGAAGPEGAAVGGIAGGVAGELYGRYVGAALGSVFGPGGALIGFVVGAKFGGLVGGAVGGYLGDRLQVHVVGE